MSHAVPCGRDSPRWSVVTGLLSWSVQPAGLPASIAGLPPSSACVHVGPPLFCSVPSNGLTGVPDGAHLVARAVRPAAARSVAHKVIAKRIERAVSHHTVGRFARNIMIGGDDGIFDVQRPIRHNAAAVAVRRRYSHRRCCWQWSHCSDSACRRFGKYRRHRHSRCYPRWCVDEIEDALSSCPTAIPPPLSGATLL